MTATTRLIAVGLAVPVLVISMLVYAAEKPSSEMGKVVLPETRLPQHATQCVEPTDVIRRDHMRLLMHQRDATVIDGIRTKQYSLVGCIDCHNASTATQPALRYENPEHFCAGCHIFTGVKIDCFECHADRPIESS